jgi:hypothetical protein
VVVVSTWYWNPIIDFCSRLTYVHSCNYYTGLKLDTWMCIYACPSTARAKWPSRSHHRFFGESPINCHRYRLRSTRFASTILLIFATMGAFLSYYFPPEPLFAIEQIPDLTGQVIIVTGYAVISHACWFGFPHGRYLFYSGNAGIGRETCKVRVPIASFDSQLIIMHFQGPPK